jgi:hypothetical protein
VSHNRSQQSTGVLPLLIVLLTITGVALLALYDTHQAARAQDAQLRELVQLCQDNPYADERCATPEEDTP